MKRVFGFVVGLAALTGAGCGDAAGALMGQSEPFELATVRFEQNATDGDAEVVFEVQGGDDGMAWLTITAPDGRTVAKFEAPDASTLGMRQVLFESPEPPDPDLVMAAYPEGTYTFEGATVAKDSLWSQAMLSHALPDPALALEPADEAESVGLTGLRVTWAPVQEGVAYIVTVEQEELELTVTATLPGSADSFTVPDGFLQAGTEYKLALGTVADGGNTSFVETTFTTREEH
jgi:hypothetical protein